MTTVALLLDTQVMIWWGQDDPRLQPAIVERIVAAENVQVSMASAWEIGIKRRLGKLNAPILTEDWLEGEGFDLLPLRLEHVREVADLPFHHKDPFDRMLVAQARVEQMTLVTSDRALGRYDVPIVWT